MKTLTLNQLEYVYGGAGSCGRSNSCSSNSRSCGSNSRSRSCDNSRSGDRGSGSRWNERKATYSFAARKDSQGALRVSGAVGFTFSGTRSNLNIGVKVGVEKANGGRTNTYGELTVGFEQRNF